MCIHIYKHVFFATNKKVSFGVLTIETPVNLVIQTAIITALFILMYDPDLTQSILSNRKRFYKIYLSMNLDK